MLSGAKYSSRATSSSQRTMRKLPLGYRMQEDFCQATATSPLVKYENEGGPGLERLFTNSFDLDDADRERSEIVGITSRFPVSIVRYCYNCGTGRVTFSVFCGVW